MKGAPRTNYSSHLLSGHLYSTCGHSRYGVRRQDIDDFSYKCSNSATAAKGHTCKPIPGEEAEELVWGEVSKLLSDPDAIMSLVDEWLGSVPERAESYRARSEEIDAKLNTLRNTRRKKIAMLVASLDEDDEQDQQLIVELKEEIAAKEKELRQEQERITEWLEEAEHKGQRADSMRKLIDQVKVNVTKLEPGDKKQILELLRVRVDIVGDTATRSGGSKNPMSEWHRKNKIKVPISVSGGQWEQIKSILEAGSNPKPEDSACFEMLLEKLRHDKSWHDYNHDERMGGKGWAYFYRVARRWFDEGTYALALKALGDYEGVGVPDGYTLPPMKIYGAIDDTPEGFVKTGAGGATASTKGITGDSPVRSAA